MAVRKRWMERERRKSRETVGRRWMGGGEEDKKPREEKDMVSKSERETEKQQGKSVWRANSQISTLL